MRNTHRGNGRWSVRRVEFAQRDDLHGPGRPGSRRTVRKVLCTLKVLVLGVASPSPSSSTPSSRLLLLSFFNASIPSAWLTFF